ncbi:MAG: hypothetical protein HPY58_03140 [Firmicutes bacterium]|nr:hypothetical protein [Bacillota bacterium]
MITTKKFNGFPFYRIWSEDQIEQLHLASLAILEQTGVLVQEPQSLKLLKEAGAYVDGERVKIPPTLVESAIRSAPERISLYSKDGRTVLPLEKGTVAYGMGADLPYFIDPFSGEIRQTVLADTERAARLAEKLTNIDWVSSLGLASDVTLELYELYQFLAIRKYSNKPILTHAANPGTLKPMIDMAAALAGGHEQLRQKPTLVVYTEPVSPLVHGRESLEKLLLCAEYGIPVTYSTGSMCGGTAPATLAAGIAMANAECLTGLVIHQLKKPGAPFIHGMMVGVLDMRTGFSPYGGPEMTLAHTIGGQLGHFYRLPTFGTAGYTDALAVDAQAGLDAAYSILLAALSDTNLVHDCGYMGNGFLGSLEQLILADELIGFVKRFMEGSKPDEEEFCIELIERIGPGGDYQSDQLAKELERDHWCPRYLNRKNFHRWQRTGGSTLVEILHEGVLDLLRKEAEIILSETEMEELERIIAENEARIKKEKRGD